MKKKRLYENMKNNTGKNRNYLRLFEISSEYNF